jgi:ribosomal protein S18 acetylase RimI-like enzyme
MLELAKDFELVRQKYIDVIENTPDMREYARWVYGQHPTDEMLKSYIDNNEMYFCIYDENIVGMIAIVMHQNDDYKTVAWEREFKNDEVSTLHILAICPEYQKKGYGTKILEEAVELSSKNGKKAVRFDALKSNVPAQKMYEKFGFEFCGIQNLYAENTGWTDFLFYEMNIDEDA